MMRRWGLLAIAGAWVALALLVAGARWLGQATAPRGFPLPDNDGCWQTLCMFGLDPDGIPAALGAEKGVVSGSVYRSPGVVGMGETRFRFDYVAGRGGRQTVELVWDPLIFLFSEKNKTLALGLRAFINPTDASWHISMAASMYLVIPITILFFVGQRYFIRGVVMTGIAGR